MLRLRLRIEATARTKNGQAPQSTTGVASTSCSQSRNWGESTRPSGSPGIISPMASTSVAAASGSEIQKRRFMSTYSGLAASSTVTVRGSSAMPQIGQLPGASRTISGCIGQVHSVRVVATDGIAGSSAMPHFGQAAGPSLSTSGSIGQIHFVPAGTSAAATGSPIASR